MTESVFPTPRAGDPEELVWALETASAMWSRGDTREAVRWLRRAVDAAGELGLEERSRGIAVAAARLVHDYRIPTVSADPGPAGKSGPPPAALLVTAVSPGVQSGSTEAADPRARFGKTVVSAESDPGDVGKTIDYDPEPAWAALAATDPAAQPLAASAQPPSPVQPTAASPVVPGVAGHVALSTRPVIDVLAAGQSTQREPEKAGLGAGEYRALRVAVRAGVSDGLFVCRVLAPGEVPDDGDRLAMLVALEPEGD